MLLSLDSYGIRTTRQLNNPSLDVSEGEKNHKKGGLNCVFGNFFLNVLDICPQVQSLSEFRVYVQRIK